MIELARRFCYIVSDNAKVDCIFEWEISPSLAGTCFILNRSGKGTTFVNFFLSVPLSLLGRFALTIYQDKK